MMRFVLSLAFVVLGSLTASAQCGKGGCALAAEKSKVEVKAEAAKTEVKAEATADVKAVTAAVACAKCGAECKKVDCPKDGKCPACGEACGKACARVDGVSPKCGNERGTCKAVAGCKAGAGCKAAEVKVEAAKPAEGK